MDVHVIVNVEIIVERDGRYLLIERAQEEDFGAGWLTFPGGKLEPHATGLRALEVTAQRELKEEVDLDVALDDLQYVESHIFYIDEVPVLDVVVMTHNATGEPRAVDAVEVAGLMWLSADEMRQHPDVQTWTLDSLASAIT